MYISKLLDLIDDYKLNEKIIKTYRYIQNTCNFEWIFLQCSEALGSYPSGMYFEW